MQSKSATLGNSKNFINRVITSLEEKRNSDQHFDKLWSEILKFGSTHKISLDGPLQCLYILIHVNNYIYHMYSFKKIIYIILFLAGRKRLKKECTRLEDYVCASSTGADDYSILKNIVESKKKYWKRTGYYSVLDTVINIIKTRFSEESLQVASSVDNLFQLNFDGSSFLINHYKVSNISIVFLV